jgi:gliding motility-associated-like protein
LVTAAVSGQNRDFFLNGRAIQLNDSCFQLTAETDTAAVGSIWYPDKVDLRNSFDLVMEMNFGCQDLRGADGMVFGLQPVSASVGASGEGLGIGGGSPALGVEFDTYHNQNRLDPLYDHVAIMANGNVSHDTSANLAGPVRALVDSDNIETCSYYALRVAWDAPTTTLRVYFDCELRLEYTADIVNTIFGGDPFVYYGFAGATGGNTNTQQVCFRFNSFLGQLEDVTICPGGRALLDLTLGERYEWSPALGLNSTTTASVEAMPDTTTIYTVKIFDECGLPLLDTVRVAVEGDSLSVELGPDTTLCSGEALNLDLSAQGAIYRWSPAVLSGPLVTIDAAGTYAVTATRADSACIAMDRLVVGAYQVPDFDIGPPDTVLCFDQTLLIDAVYPEGQGFTEQGQPFDSLLIDRPGVYRYTYEHPCVLQTDEIAIEYSSCRKYYMPTAISPNEDGRNDWLFPQDIGDLTVIHRFSVFDRWGSMLFETDSMIANSPETGWDGTLRDKPLDTGVYVWMMDVTFRNGERSIESGTVTVVR